MKTLLLAVATVLLAFPAFASSTLYVSGSGGNVGIGTITPNSGAALDLSPNTNSLLLPNGTTLQRPTGGAGMVRYNSTNTVPEFYITSWLPVPLTASSPISINSTTGNITCSTCNTSAANVNSISGDGTLVSNSVSTGAVTLTLKNATAYSVWGNNTPSSATPSYITSPVLSGTITDLQSIAATSTDGLILTDTIAATSGNQKWSPRLRWTGQGWKTNTTAASQEVDAIAEVQPLQGTVNPTFNWVLSSQVNGGGYSPLLTVPSSGGLNLASGVYQINGVQLAASNLQNGVTGSGSIVLSTSPILTTPNIGTATATTPLAGDNSTNVATTAFVASAIRTRLTANTTFYVSTAGSDSSNCLTSGTACATLNHVWTLIAGNYDLANFTATIQLADGTYTNGLIASVPALGGPVVINGDATTPSNVIISPASGDCLQALGIGVLFTPQNLEMTSTSGSSDLVSLNGGTITVGPGLIFGAAASQINAQTGGTIYIQNSYSVTGGGNFHYYVADGSLVRVNNAITATFTGTPAYSQFVASSIEGAKLILVGTTYSGSATGTRYSSTLNAVINTNSGNTSFIPGSAAGSTSSGGQYN